MVRVLTWNLCWEFQKGEGGGNAALQQLPKRCVRGGGSGPLTSCAAASADEVRAHLARGVDVVCLQEIGSATWPAWLARASAGLPAVQSADARPGPRLQSSVLYDGGRWTPTDEAHFRCRGRVFQLVRFAAANTATAGGGGGQRLDVLNVNLWHGGTPADLARMVAILYGVVAAAQAPPGAAVLNHRPLAAAHRGPDPAAAVVLAGDLNLVGPDALPAVGGGVPVLRCLPRGQQRGGPTCCFTDARPTSPLAVGFDHVYAGGGAGRARVTTHRVVPTTAAASDHRPVVAEVALA